MVINEKMNETFLGNLNILPKLAPNVVNLIYAPVGSGKSSFIKNNLVNAVNDKREILYLTDTTAGRDQAINDEPMNLTTYTKQWDRLQNHNLILGWGDWQTFPKNKVPIMTYSKMAHLIKANPHFGTGILKYIVLDECHNLKIYQSFSDDKTLQLLERWLKHIYYNTDIIIIALSATPKMIYKMFPHDRLIDILTQNEKDSLRTLKANKELHFPSIYNVLGNLPQGKIVIYTSHIGKIKEYENIIKTNSKSNLVIDSIWSRQNEKHPLNDRQLYVWDSILEKSLIPSETDILLYNASCLTGINIENHIDAVIIDDYCEDVQTQARGRIRNDIDRYYKLSKQPDCLDIPPDFLGVPIFQNVIPHIDNLIDYRIKQELTDYLRIGFDGHTKGWNTISQFLKQSDDYVLNGGLRHSIGGKKLSYNVIKLKG